ncbi:hypothetical protein [Kitasatospora sp. NPDC058046]|uniref:hypothetical protein n=1 Tax=Kitasatospora sp. NPDC058046 TaxID=3346312 RepID=UPI0036D7DF11
MEPIRIAPGLLLSEAQYETAAAAVAAHAPEVGPLAWSTFTDPMRWWLVPDLDGRLSKAELTLREDAERTVKINIWHLPDLRGPDGAPRPHSHPWRFESFILAGGYAEDRYVLDAGRVVEELGVEHRKGGVNGVPRELYHEVTHVEAPGETMTLMVCGLGVRGSWRHLDPATGRLYRPDADPGFSSRLQALNPHRA